MTTHEGHPQVVAPEAWLTARDELREREDAHLDDLEALNAQRRGLPMVPFEKPYVFSGTDGDRGLVDLFEGRSQLIVYHFWFEPGEGPCPGCSLWTSDLGDLTNLHERDTSLVFVSRAPIGEIDSAKSTRGWTMPWYALQGEDFNADTGYADVAQISVFLRDREQVFLTYLTRRGRDLQTISNHWDLLERTPSGP